jgi:transposase-like protein
MLTKRCCDCGQVKRVELFDIDRHTRTGRSGQCKDCRRQRQTRSGYAACRNRALRQLARQHPDEYQRYRQQARQQLAPDTATAKVWDQARGRALAELGRRHRAEWHQHYRQVRAAHPDWSAVQASNAATARQRRAHHPEYLELLAGYARARRAGPKLVAKLIRRAQRLLQLAHPQEYQDLYAAERAKLANPAQPPQEGGLGG